MSNENISKFAQNGYVSLRSDLDIDKIRGKYMHNTILQQVYNVLFTISNNFFNFLTIYITSSGQIADFNLSYIRQTKHTNHLIVICFLTLYWFLARQFLWKFPFQLKEGETEEQTEMRENKQRQNVQNKHQNERNQIDEVGGLDNEYVTPKKMRLIDFTVDLVRIIDTGLVYYVLEKEVFRVSVDEHVKIIDYLLMLMWFLYSGRHIIFWLDNIRQKQKYLQYWSAKNRIPGYLQFITAQNMKKAQDLKNGIQNYHIQLKKYEEQQQKNRKRGSQKPKEE